MIFAVMAPGGRVGTRLEAAHELSMLGLTAQSRGDKGEIPEMVMTNMMVNGGQWWFIVANSDELSGKVMTNIAIEHGNVMVINGDEW